MFGLPPSILGTAFNPIILTTLASLGIVTSYLAYNHYHRVPANSTDNIDYDKFPLADLEPAFHEDSVNRTYGDIPTVNHTDFTNVIPEAFDARLQWPECKELIGKVWDQGSCQSCWAISAASVMTDRICIQSKGSSKPILSPQHLICSCTNCTRLNHVNQSMPMCNGGDSESAWEFWKQMGLVSGGDYGTNGSCLPYLASPCAHDPIQSYADFGLHQCRSSELNYTCPTQCSNSGNTLDSEKKYFGSKIYYVNNNTLDIQKEIFQFGSVQAKHYFDKKFLFHKKGVYKYGGLSDHVHSVKIIGWNKTEKGDPYWLCVNSFGTHWGEEGFFKIPRGPSKCAVEESVMAGTPRLDSQTPSQNV